MRGLRLPGPYSGLHLRIQVKSTTGTTGKEQNQISPWFVLPEHSSENRCRWLQPRTRKIMRDNLKEFIGEALCQPSDYVSYFASVKLAEMYPGAAISENESWAFNLPDYVEAGLCSVW